MRRIPYAIPGVFVVIDSSHGDRQREMAGQVVEQKDVRTRGVPSRRINKNVTRRGEFSSRRMVPTRYSDQCI